MKNTIKEHKWKYMDPNTLEWDKLANNLARSWVSIKACKHCGRPVVDGYCCGFCDSDTP